MPKKPKKGPRKTSSGKVVPVAPQRMSYALALFGDGDRYSAVRTALMKRFKISDSTAEEDIRRAYKAIAEEDEKEKPQLAARVANKLWRVANDAHTAGEYAASASALGRLMKLHGLEAPKHVQVTGGISPEQRQLLDALAMTPAERERRMVELERAVGGVADDERAVEAQGDDEP